MMSSTMPVLKLDAVVRGRHSNAATTRSETCCSTGQSLSDLSIIPENNLKLDRDRHDLSTLAEHGDVVLILGSGAGKTSFLTSSVVGATGQVTGVEGDDGLLTAARHSRLAVSSSLGFENIEFRKGSIHDLKLDCEQLDRVLAEHPVTTSAAWMQLGQHADWLRETAPLIETGSITLALVDCESSPVPSSARPQFFRELFRVLKVGGRCVARVQATCGEHPNGDASLDLPERKIVFSEEELFSGFESAGFGGIEILEHHSSLSSSIDGRESRCLTVRAHKLTLNCCADWDGSDATEVIYRGPWKSVMDDAGHTFVRGQRLSVCTSTAGVLKQSPYKGQMLFAGGTMAERSETHCCDSGENGRNDRCC